MHCFLHTIHEYRFYWVFGGSGSQACTQSQLWLSVSSGHFVIITSSHCSCFPHAEISDGGWHVLPQKKLLICIWQEPHADFSCAEKAVPLHIVRLEYQSRQNPGARFGKGPTFSIASFYTTIVRLRSKAENDCYSIKIWQWVCALERRKRVAAISFIEWFLSYSRTKQWPMQCR